MAHLLDGRALAARVREKIKIRLKAHRGSQPGLAILLVGNDPASHTYVGLKGKACEEVGIHFETYLYPEFVEEQELIEKIWELNGRDEIHGILVQLPLPAGIHTDNVITAIHPNKDVDGFHKENRRRLKAGEPGIVSAVALGIMKLVDETQVRGGSATIVSSPLFAEPLVELLKERDMKTTVVDQKDPRLSEKTKTADVLIVAEGTPGLITGDMIKHGAVVMDVGTTKVDEKIVGDVNFDSVEPVAGWITPVPGGVGPMTVAMLLVNVMKAYEMQKRS